MKNKFDGMPIPVMEGDVKEVTIESIGEKGDGIAKIKGFVIVVPKATRGEKVWIKITAIRGRVGFATLLEDQGGVERATN